jgi:hypothetical protein
LDLSNTRLKKKTKKFHLKNILIYSSLFTALILIIGLSYFDFSNDSFKNHLVTADFNQSQIFIKQAKGAYYPITKDTDQRWITNDGLFISINTYKIVFQNTKNNKKGNLNTYELWIPKDNQYALVLIDGTEIKLNGDSYIRFNNNRISNLTQISLLGEAYFNVSHDSNHPFKINASNMNVEVYGTEFNLSNYQRENFTSIALVEGSVKVSNLQKQSRFIKPGQKATLYNNSDKLIVEKAKLDETVVWNATQFYFSGEALESILKKLAIWYKKEFIINKSSIKKIKFTGSLKKEEGLISFLQMLKYTENISYTINDKTITLNK